MAGTSRKKIAVVVTHGIGEQIPMATLRGFVDTAWVTDANVHWRAPADERPGDIWIKPDAATGSLELRRITTRWTRTKASPDEKGPRVDFFEFYWADLAEGTTVQEVWDWLGSLLWRWPSQVPQGVMAAWLLLWAVTLVVMALSLFAVLPWPGGWWHVILAGAAAAVGYGMNYVVAPYAGDVARYVRADPRNVAMRREIRDRGLKLLKKLHDCGAYERIIFVGHSLGTVIAYDLVSLLWAMREKALLVHEDEAAFGKLRAVEEAAQQLAGAGEADRAAMRQAFREAQRAFRLTLRSGGEDGTLRKREPDEEWLISDLVTLGSPLTHAVFLLAKNKADLDDKIATWLFPTDSPQFQKIESEQRGKIEARPDPVPPNVWGPAGGLFSYFIANKTWSLHHAAPFAAVRWTNIYDPHQMIFRGDIISGPAVPVFGSGVRDIDLKALRGQSPVFSHTLYWTPSAGDPNGSASPGIDALRKAIDLFDRPDGDIW
jgi:hypothetical protein